MEFTFIVVIALILLFIYLISKSGKTHNQSGGIKYKQVDALFSKAELSIYHIITQCLNDNHILIGKVRVADVLTPDLAKGDKRWRSAFAKISQKHFDFIVIDSATLNPVLAIELDDKSHTRKSVIERDHFVNKATESASLPLLRIPAQKGYALDEIKALLAQHI